MMHDVIDTLATVRSLEEAGMETRSAEAVTEAIRRAVTEGGATRTDLAGLETGVRAEINGLKTAVRADLTELRAEVRADLADFKAEIRADLAALTWRILGGVGLLLAVFTAVDRLLA